MAEKETTGKTLELRMDRLQKTVDQLLDVQKAQQVGLRRFVDLLKEMTYVDGYKRGRLGVADIN